MPRRSPTETRRRVVELARAGTKVTQLATTFAIAEARIWVHAPGASAIDLVARAFIWIGAGIRTPST